MSEGRSRVGLQDVARTAGVGVATVDRVLNERGNVSPATARRVLEAARQLGLRRLLPRPYLRRVRIEVLLARPDTLFLARLARGFSAVAATLDRAVVLQRTTLVNAEPAKVAARLRGSGADAVIFYGEDHPEIAAAIDALAAAGRPVVSIVTDVSRATGRLAYVGIDNLKAGRTAGFLSARLARRPGPALVLTNSLGFRAHVDRVEGFREGLAREAPGTPVAVVIESRDEDDRSAHLVKAALADHPDAVALYNTGGAVAAVASVLRRRGSGWPRDLVYIGHELSPGNADLLREGLLSVVIDQALELQASRAVEILLHRLGYLDTLPPPTEVPFTLHTRENA
jgi:LacI family transcriptional regulator